ncbi:uncharacterized protein TRIVIDRAFT_223858 [Trichoderma virens Gv29-8]|uniref:Uncharacterized protein n=1 Tax=Hypocrea virens (strain Gv29-8 / FGSC 10586) TaxID=413071 RepID=G9MYB9_HYPVG|nr:uncharacterized protein TRIVIDRAFT_223858 [Trichoderma virens Gv29-8]EHK20541.1 hypothetical protein TRIVIDRAFT_223858 [Trichoderma virens Gv29-8]UKZ53000.1 hypothetical protein TrVGV298_006787 [Trichoderma virens]
MTLIREHAPPSYQEVSNHSPRVQLPIGELLSLALDGRSIYSATNPELVYYELSAAPLQATSLIYVVKKVKYRLAGDSRVRRLRTRQDDIYLFRDAYVNFYAPRRIVIDGKSSDARCYKEVKLSPGLMGWSTCTAAGHFTAKTGLSDRWRHHHQVIWKDDSGRIVAMEDKASPSVPVTAAATAANSDHAAPAAVPCLKLLRMLDEKDLDLLVTCWTARVWKQAQKSLSGPPTGRSRVKRFAARYLRLRYMTDLVSSKSTPTRRLEA